MNDRFHVERSRSGPPFEFSGAMRPKTPLGDRGSLHPAPGRQGDQGTGKPELPRDPRLELIHTVACTDDQEITQSDEEARLENAGQTLDLRIE